MVAKINITKDVLKALNYNERKVQKGQAACIAAGNYLREAHQMTFDQKLWGLENRNALNDRATTKTLHLSLNFAPSEQLSQEKLAQIAAAYLEKIGFGEQPYLVYEHRDAGHPHVHIVTTTIRADGRRIPTHNIGRSLSERARKEMEASFQLKSAEKQKQLLKKQHQKPERLVYGQGETKRGIARVLEAVLTTYHYTCLAELNAVLNQFSVVADCGQENRRIHQNKGLVYRMLDDRGNKIGVPIKASSIEGRPTLAFLETQFERNVAARAPYREKIIQAIEEVLSQPNTHWQTFREALKNRAIACLLMKNRQASGTEIFFVDNETKCVFEPNALGTTYSSMLQSCLQITGAFPSSEQNRTQTQAVGKEDSRQVLSTQDVPHQHQATHFEKTLHPAKKLRKEETTTPWDLKKNRSRKNKLHR